VYVDMDVYVYVDVDVDVDGHVDVDVDGHVDMDGHAVDTWSEASSKIACSQLVSLVAAAWQMRQRRDGASSDRSRCAGSISRSFGTATRGGCCQEAVSVS
jgi:hypothetical protein